jgi:trans-aconitate 2-methyltransferase
MAHTWDPERYLTYADERGRPFVELVARIGATAPGEVVDLGCGPGNLTGLLAERWPGAVAPGGWLAFQVPGNFDEPSHTIRAELAAEAPYAELTAGVATPSSHDPAVYYDALTAAGCSVDVWETTYTHVLRGPDPVFTWVSGTGARPTLQALPDDLRPAFETEFKRRLAAAYPVRADGTVLLPFRRVFAVARRS